MTHGTSRTFRRMLTRLSGFTMIELAIVIVIIAMLAGTGYRFFVMTDRAAARQRAQFILEGRFQRVQHMLGGDIRSAVRVEDEFLDWRVSDALLILAGPAGEKGRKRFVYDFSNGFLNRITLQGEEIVASEKLGRWDNVSFLRLPGGAIKVAFEDSYHKHHTTVPWRRGVVWGMRSFAAE